MKKETRRNEQKQEEEEEQAELHAHQPDNNTLQSPKSLLNQPAKANDLQSKGCSATVQYQ